MKKNKILLLIAVVGVGGYLLYKKSKKTNLTGLKMNSCPVQCADMFHWCLANNNTNCYDNYHNCVASCPNSN